MTKGRNSTKIGSTGFVHCESESVDGLTTNSTTPPQTGNARGSDVLRPRFPRVEVLISHLPRKGLPRTPQGISPQTGLDPLGESGESKAQKIKLKKVKKPKDETLRLSEEDVFTFITSMNLKTHPVEETANTYTFVRREFITAEFGGDPIGMYARPHEKHVKRHKIPLIVCPNLSLNPYAPAMPGRPGLLFHICKRPQRDEDDKKGFHFIDKPAPVFSRIEVNKWTYVGDYIERGDRTLSVEQWRTQSTEVKTAWIRNILVRRWSTFCRMSIKYRRDNGKEPFREDVDELVGQCLSGQIVDDVTEEEISAAFDRGDEKIRVTGVECVNHDAEFLNNVVTKYATWEKSLQNARRRPEAKRSPAKKRRRNDVKELEYGHRDA